MSKPQSAKAALLGFMVAVALATALSARAAEDLFPPELFDQFRSWESVTLGEASFESEGHSDQRVRAYFNPESRAAYDGTVPLPFREGSIIAKAVVKNDQPTAEASRIYFMRKMPAGYDAENGDWAYGFANRQADGSYRLNANPGRMEACIECHQDQARYDYVGTVRLYREQRPFVSQ